jgi:hypothetical protein
LLLIFQAHSTRGTATASLAGPTSGGSSCAASAAGIGEFICVINSNNDLVAVWQSEKADNGALTNAQLNFLDLGITATSGDVLSVGDSSCTSTVDITGDINTSSLPSWDTFCFIRR